MLSSALLFLIGFLIVGNKPYFVQQALASMEQTTIQFPSMQQLWAFQRCNQLRNFDFDATDCTLRAILTAAQIQEALTSFQGRRMDQQKTA